MTDRNKIVDRPDGFDVWCTPDFDTQYRQIAAVHVFEVPRPNSRTWQVSVLIEETLNGEVTWSDRTVREFSVKYMADRFIDGIRDELPQSLTFKRRDGQSLSNWMWQSECSRSRRYSE